MEVGYGNVIHMHDHLKDLGRVEALVGGSNSYKLSQDLLNILRSKGIRVLAQADVIDLGNYECQRWKL